MPLTTRGICVQILSSVRALREHSADCSTNDCKVVLNHLVRKFSEPLARVGRQHRLLSRRVADGETDDTVDDHAVPVIVILEELLAMDTERLTVSDQNLSRLERLLADSLTLVEITREEDLLLCAHGLQRRMPEGWRFDQLAQDRLARYRQAGIEVVGG